MLFLIIFIASVHRLAFGDQTWSSLCPASDNYFAGKEFLNKYHVAYGNKDSHIDDCPVRKENVLTALSVANWEQNAEAFGRIAKAGHSSEQNHSVNVIVIGGSMTRGGDIDCSCFCEDMLKGNCPSRNQCSDERTCTWVNNLRRWFAGAYNNTKITFFDYSEGGLSSQNSLQAFGEKMKRSGATLSANDIVFIDQSVNDACKVVSDIKRYIELLVRTILRFSGNKGDQPTIIMIEQYPHKHCGSAIHPYSDPHSPTDVAHSYRQVSKHYGLLYFSLREVYWTYFGLNAAGRSYAEPSPLKDRYYPISPFNRAEHIENHPPWYVHLFIADVIAGCIMQVMQQLRSEANPTSKYLPHWNATQLPAPFYNITDGYDAATCDIKIPYVLDAHPNGTFHPANVKAYETDIATVSKAGWREYSDHHDTSGWIINELANPAMRTLTFQVPNVILPGGTHRILRLLKVTYLTSYEGMGKAFMTLCGQRLAGDLDGLNEKDRVSVPAVFVHHMTNYERTVCEGMHASARNLTFTHVPVNETVRQVHHNKFKIMDVELCYPALLQD